MTLTEEVGRAEWTPRTELEEQFSYHAPTPEQIVSYQVIREAGKALALVILEQCPSCADRTAAIRKVREAVLTANASIAIPRT